MLTNEHALNQVVTTAPTSEKQRIVAANSTILFLLAYLVCYIFSQLSIIGAAFFSKIPTVFYPGHLEFKIADAEWTRDEVIFVYGAGPVVALAIAFLAAPLFIWVRKKKGLQKTFLLWTFLHGCNLFFGALLAGTITKSGFWYAIRWSGLSDTAVWITAFIFIAVLLVIGILAAPAFLISCDSISLMQFKNRKKMLAATVMWPWISGSVFLTLLKFPDLQYYELLQFFTLMFMLLPVYFLNQQSLYSQTVKMPQKTRLAHTALILVVVFAFIFRVYVQNGRFIG